MSRFDRHGLRRFSARDAISAVAVTGILLVLMAGASIRTAGERMNDGIGRTLILAIGKPAGWLADQLPLAGVTHDATAWLSPDKKLSKVGSFNAAIVSKPGVAGGQIPLVTPDAFDPVALGAQPPVKRPLHTLLVTGDSLSTPLDADLARTLAARGVHVIRDPHLGTGISKSTIVDWGQLSSSQVSQYHPDAVVVFIGANEGFPMQGPDGRQVQCCGPDWAAIYANRARKMAATYRQQGVARIYWLTVPTPRDSARQSIIHVVNAAIEVAVQPWRAQIRLIDTVPIFTPAGYRDSMPINGAQTIVREPDGIHLNDAGSSLLSGTVLKTLSQDYAG